MRASLTRFSTEAERAVNRMWSEVQRTRAWLSEREQYWRIVVAQCERAHDDALLELRRYEDERRTAVRDRLPGVDAGYGAQQQTKLRRAAARLADAQKGLSTVRYQRKRFEEGVVTYQMQRQRLRSFLAQDVAHAGSLLSHSIATVENYFQGRMAAEAEDFFHKTSSAAAVSMTASVEAPGTNGASAVPRRPDPGYFRDADGRQMVVYVFQWGDLHMVRVYDRQELLVPPDDPTIADVGMADFSIEYDENGQATRGRLLGLIVMPKYRTSRTGSRILAVVERITQHYGAHEVYGAAPDDKRARAWFTQRGYYVDANGAEIVKGIPADKGDFDP